MGGKHILVLGGAGAMGRYAVRALTQFDFVARVIVAGLPSQGVPDIIENLAQDGVRLDWVEFDLNDEAALRQLIRQVDIVLNATGPFFRFGLKVARAALAEKKHYFDICDDVEPALEILALHQQAVGAGVTMVTGLGASPGITNLLAVRAAAALDEVDALDTSWDLSAAADVAFFAGEKPPSTAPKAASVHWMYACSGQVCLLRHGAWVEERPLQQEEIALPDGQRYSATIVAHPEAVTLPRRFPALQSCINFMSGPQKVMDVLCSMRDRIDSQEVTVDAAAQEMHQLKPSSKISLEEEKEMRRAQPPIPPVLCAIANGTKDGRPARAAAWINRLPPGGLGACTGIPAALGVLLLQQGKIRASGAFAPEDIIDPSDFFPLLEPYCRNLEDGRPLVEVSWAFAD